jgi:hypothetical protein
MRITGISSSKKIENGSWFIDRHVREDVPVLFFVIARAEPEAISKALAKVFYFE